jgi:lipopolysaccharide biosynthesis glycosyltransferase
MYEDVTIVSGGDSKYFQLLKELALSIREKHEGKSINIVYLDGGLTSEDINYFKSLNIEVVDPGWCNPIAEQKAAGRNFLKINIAKMHLDKILSNRKIIIWIDADAWLQTFASIDLFSMVANKNKLAIVSQATRLESKNIQFKKIFTHRFVELRNILYKNARRAGLKTDLIEKMQGRPTLNAGAYSLHVKAPHWERLRHWQNEILKKGRLFTSDQLSIGLTIYHDQLTYEALPDICNYIYPWRYDEDKNLFVDYFAPYTPVSIVHLAGQDQSRNDHLYKVKMLNQNDQIIKKTLRYKK